MRPRKSSTRSAMTRFGLVVACLTLVATVTLSQDSPKPPAASQEGPAFPAKVELVTVDAVVVDGKGKALAGLTKDDFIVLENGVPQTVSSFEAVTLPELAAPAEAARRLPYSSNLAPETRHGRTFVVVFDDVHMSPFQAQRAKAAVGEFLRTGVRNGDRVTLIATSGTSWWNAQLPDGRESLMAVLKRMDGRYVQETAPDRVTDYEAMRIMAYDDADMGYQVQRRLDAYGNVGRERQGDRQYSDTLRTNSAVGLIDPYVRSRATDVYEKSISRRRITMAIMTRALRSLAETRGRKAMVLVSQGFVYEPDFKEMKPLVEASLRVNVPVYFIDTRGLKALPDFMTAEFANPFDVQDTVAVLADITRDAEGAENIALDTGGFAIKNTNDLSAGVLRVSAESLAYYLLGYNPTDATRDGKFRRIEVKLAPAKAKGLKVRARRGYYAPGDAPVAVPKSKDADPEILRALDSPFEKREVPIRVAAFCFDEVLSSRASVFLVTEVDIRELALREEDGRFKDTLAVLVELQHRDTGEYYRNDQKVEMAMLPETRRSLSATWYTIPQEVTLPAGGYQAKVVVRDLGNGRIGSVIHDFEVPTLEVFRISTPILADTLEARESDSSSRPPRPVLQVRRSFGRGATLYVQYSVLGAAKDGTTQRPMVSSGYQIRRPDGSVLKGAAATRITPTSLGALIRLHGISLAVAEPGEYDLVLSVRDEVANRNLEIREPFVVEATAPVASGQR